MDASGIQRLGLKVISGGYGGICEIADGEAIVVLGGD